MEKIKKTILKGSTIVLKNQAIYFWILKWGNPYKNHFFMKSWKIIEKSSTQLALKRYKQLFLD
ncbi:hypothetical protein [Acinetobacter nosocomialis]|uniref:hypothetical protein n=1 Tax=Acinetobacter nosocomialis TaxID=106654 RepID=UPI0024DED9BF|nr:hypothetical protein [Acinetobacter nosocomialis]